MADGWKSSLERSLLPVAFRTGAYRPARFLNRGKAVILTYHGFINGRDGDGIANHEGKHVHADDFRAQLAFLKEHYRVLPLAEIVRLLASGDRLPPRAAVITIDDGYRSTYTIAYPALREAGLAAVVFLATDYVDNKRHLWTDRVEYAMGVAPAGNYELNVGAQTLHLNLQGRDSRIAADRLVRSTLKALPQSGRDDGVDALERALGQSLGAAAASDLYAPMEWSEAAEMAASGVMAIGSHTHSHVILTRCRPEAAADELTRSKMIIEERLGMPCDLFCYPNGRRGDFDQNTGRLVRDAGYRCALTTVHGMNGSGADVYALRRYPVTGRMVAGELAVRLSGVVELPAAMKDAALGRGRWRIP